MLFRYLVLLAMVLISVAFVTLIEQKVLGARQIRLGPNNVGYYGLFQPFADAVKLFCKESAVLWKGSLRVYFFSPVFNLLIVLILWLLYPYAEGGLRFRFGIIYFISIRALGLFPILSSRWSSNCKYSILGGLRAVAQIISYEVSLAISLLSVIWMRGSFDLCYIVWDQINMYYLILILPLAIVWFVSILAETNRTPYDFSEGESELVSGFNTEYRSGGFTLIFIAEYARILFIRLFFCLVFWGGLINFVIIVKMIVIGFIFIWVRRTIPRYRYDKLMYLVWKKFLPVILFFFLFYISVGYFFV